MKFSPKAAFAACLLVLASCGGGDLGGGDLKSRSIDTVSDFVSAFETIKDKETAEAAVDDLNAIAAKMKTLSEEMGKLPKEEKDAMEAELATEGDEVTKKMMAEVMRVMQIPGAAEVLAPVMEEMAKIDAK